MCAAPVLLELEHGFVCYYKCASHFLLSHLDGVKKQDRYAVYGVDGGDGVNNVLVCD